MGILTHQAYLGRIKGPVIMNAILWLVVALLSILVLAPWMEGFLEIWPAAMVWIPKGAGKILLTFVLASLLFMVPMSLFLNPVLDPLSRVAEKQALGWEPPRSGRKYREEFWDSVDTGGRIYIMSLGVILCCLPLSLFYIGLPLGLFLASFLCGFAWLDYPMSRRGGSRGAKFQEKWVVAKKHWALLTGFGFCSLLGMLVPFFGLLLAGPASAVGISALYFDCRVETDATDDSA